MMSLGTSLFVDVFATHVPIREHSVKESVDMYVAAVMFDATTVIADCTSVLLSA